MMRVESLVQDLRYAARGLAARPGFAAAAVLTLAIGVGLNATLAGVVRAVFLAPLPYPRASRLVYLTSAFPGFPQGGGNFSYPDFAAMSERVRSLEAVAAYEGWGGVVLTGDGDPVRVAPNFVTASYFELLGARAQAGRLILPDENRRSGSPAVAVIGHRLWQHHLGADPAIIGRTISLNAVPYVVVGVMNPTFRDLTEQGGTGTDVWLPAAAAERLLRQPPLDRVVRIFWGVGRIAPGRTFADVREEIERLGDELARDRPDTHRGFGLRARTLERQLRGEMRVPILALAGGGACILLIACGNVAMLVLARTRANRRELAVRAALGASTGRLASVVLAQCLWLAAAGGLLGMLAAVWAVDGLASWAASILPAFVVLRVDGATYAASLGIAILVLLLIGTLPAVEGSRMNLRDALSSRGQGRGAGRLPRAAVVAVQTGLAVVLLAGAGLLLRSFSTLTSSGLGFDTTRLLTFRIDLAAERYRTPEARVAATRDLIERLQNISGVASASAWGPSMLGRATWVTYLLPEGRPADAAEGGRQISRHSISPGALRNLGLALRRGREFTWDDGPGAPRVAIVSESLAAAFWPGEDPIGRRIRYRLLPDAPPILVVGVAADARHRARFHPRDAANGVPPAGLGPQLDVYLPASQRAESDLAVALRGVDQVPSAAAVRSVLATVDPHLALHDVASLDERVRRQEAPFAITSGLLGLYAAVALLLAAVGVFGVVSEIVRHRTHEFGVRLALGARPAQVMSLVMRQSVMPAVAGTIAGLSGAIGASRLLASLMYGVSASDTATLLTASLLLLGTALAAAAGPARLAARVDPAVTLRAE
jgi:predicted permease